MKQAEILEIVETLYQDNWTDTDMFFDNVPENITEGSDWFRLTVVPVNSENMALGDRVQKNGFIVIQGFTPLNSGTRQLAGLCDKIIELGENKQFLGSTAGQSLFTYAADLARLGDDGNNWYQINVTIPYEGT